MQNQRIDKEMAAITTLMRIVLGKSHTNIPSLDVVSYLVARLDDTRLDQVVKDFAYHSMNDVQLGLYREIESKNGLEAELMDDHEIAVAGQLVDLGLLYQGETDAKNGGLKFFVK